MADKIKTALGALELPDRASIKQIKTQYKKLIHRWHPDKCQGIPSECHEKTVWLIEAYKLLMGYCENYTILFDDAKTETQEEFWARHYGNDPVWGKPGDASHEK